MSSEHLRSDNSGSLVDRERSEDKTYRDYLREASDGILMIAAASRDITCLCKRGSLKFEGNIRQRAVADWASPRLKSQALVCSTRFLKQPQSSAMPILAPGKGQFCLCCLTIVSGKRFSRNHNI